MNLISEDYPDHADCMYDKTSPGCTAKTCDVRYLYQQDNPDDKFCGQHHYNANHYNTNSDIELYCGIKWCCPV